jgi:hypothetical protein
MTRCVVARALRSPRTPRPATLAATAATKPAARPAADDRPPVRELLRMWFSGFD